MKTLSRIIVFFTLLVLLIIICLSVYLAYFGKTHIQRTLSSALNKDVKVKGLFYLPPFGLKVTWVNVDNTFSAEQVRMQIDPASLLKGAPEAYSVRIIKPVLVLNSFKLPKKTINKQTRPLETGGADISDSSKSGDALVKKSVLKATHGFKIKRLKIQEGRLDYLDKKNNGKYAFSLNHCLLNAGPVSLPKPALSQFSLSARFAENPFPVPVGQVDAGGWIDIGNKSMNAEIKIINSEGNPGLIITAISKNNEMKVVGEGDLYNMIYSSKKDERWPSDLLIGALSSFGVNVQAGFSFETKMDDFTVPENISVSGRVYK